MKIGKKSVTICIWQKSKEKWMIRFDIEIVMSQIDYELIDYVKENRK